jgi:hypothetical protein
MAMHSLRSLGLFVIASTLIVSTAEAARLGGGKSGGMSPSYSHSPANSYSSVVRPCLPHKPVEGYRLPDSVARNAIPALTSNRRGPGWGGVVASYMFGNTESPHVASLLGHSSPSHDHSENQTDNTVPKSGYPQSLIETVSNLPRLYQLRQS